MITLFDGKCVLCNKSVDLLLQIDTDKCLVFTSIQGNFAKSLPLKDIDLNNPKSIIVWHNNNLYQKSQGIFLILKKLPYPWKLLYIFSITPNFISDFFYDVIAKNRYNWFGKSQNCRIPSSEERKQFLD